MSIEMDTIFCQRVMDAGFWSMLITPRPDVTQLFISRYNHFLPSSHYIGAAVYDLRLLSPSVMMIADMMPSLRPPSNPIFIDIDEKKKTLSTSLVFYDDSLRPVLECCDCLPAVNGLRPIDAMSWKDAVIVNKICEREKKKE